MQGTVRFCSVPPQFRRRKPWGGQGHPTSFSLPPTSRENLRLDGYLEYPYAGQTADTDGRPELCPILESAPETAWNLYASPPGPDVVKFLLLGCVKKVPALKSSLNP
ncbi:hypothetical protein TNCV_5008071 [Trichonephila clavipes]|nr:hypothetical protein TNCV_5008071 [Trichonephila clavipes]